MFAVVTVLMLPAIATVAPLFVMLNRIQVNLGDIQFNLRNSLLGVAVTLTAGQLPFRDLESEGLSWIRSTRSGGGGAH